MKLETAAAKSVMGLLIYGLIGALLSVQANAEEGQGFFGLQVQELPDRVEQAIDLQEAGGVLVRNVAIHSPANLAGLKVGDHIVQMQGQSVPDVGTLLEQIKKIPAGSSFDVKIYRQGESKTLTVTLSDWPPEWQVNKDSFFALPSAGITVAAITPKVRDRFALKWEHRGLVVTIVNPTMPMGALLKRGDIIHQVNLNKVWDPSHLEQAYLKAKADGKSLLLLLVETAKGKSFITLPVK